MSNNLQINPVSFKTIAIATTIALIILQLAK